jgi:hypothetical protein
MTQRPEQSARPARRNWFTETRQQEARDILHHSLPGLLPAGYRIAVHRRFGTVTVITCTQEEEASASSEVRASMTHQQSFTPAELSLLLPLIEAYPDYCPSEVLLAHYTSGEWRPLTTEEVTAARKRLRRAEQAGTSEDLLRPLRNLLSRTRLKLHGVGLTITSLLETGYQLMPLERVRVSPRKREQEASEHGSKETGGNSLARERETGAHGHEER